MSKFDSSLSYVAGIPFSLLAIFLFVLALSLVIHPDQLDGSIIFPLVVGVIAGNVEIFIARWLARGGEVHGVLSNIWGILIISALNYVFALGIRVDIGWGMLLAGVLVALNAAIWGDLLLKGNYDDWLWVLSDSQIGRLRRKVGPHLVNMVLGFFAFAGGGVLATFLRVLVRYSLSSRQLPIDIPLISQTGLVILFLILTGIMTICLVAIRKYQMISSKGDLSLEQKSLGLLKQYLLYKLRGRGEPVSGSLLLKRIRQEQILWGLLLAISIALIETGLFLALPDHSSSLFTILFFTVPVAIILLFGIVGHTTSGELGGAGGVLLATTITAGISWIVPRYTWSAELFVLVSLSALVAWIIGLLNGVLIKGVQRMSILTFVIEIMPDSAALPQLPESLIAIRRGLEGGYMNGAQKLFGNVTRPVRARSSAGSGLLFSDPGGMTYLGEDNYRFSATYQQRPSSQQVYYALCVNRLIDADLQEDERRMMPLLPVSYYHCGYLTGIDVDAVNTGDGIYRMDIWHRNEPVELTTAAAYSSQASRALPAEWSCGYRKQLSEFFDHMLTRRIDIDTDVFYHLNDGDSETTGGKWLLVGFSRARTSTATYVTLETEVIVGEVVKALCDGFQTHLGVTAQVAVYGRLYYPRVSIYDFGFEYDTGPLLHGHWAGTSTPATAPELAVIKKYLEYLPEHPIIPANLRQRLILWLVQISITGLLATLGLGDSVVSNILHSFLGGG